MRGALPRPPAADAALAAGLAALVVWEILASDVDGDRTVLIPAALGATLPLAWRRSAPLPVAAVVASAVVAMTALHSGSQEPQTPILALLILAFSVGAYGEPRPAVIGLVLLLGALLADEPGDFVVLGPVHGAAWGAGRVLFARQLEAAASRGRAGELELERDQARAAMSEERGRIARELHDIVAHNVSVIVMQAGAERLARPQAPAATRETLESIERSGREALVEMHRLLGVLREPEQEGVAMAPQPGLAELDRLAEHVRGAGLPVEVEVEGEPLALPPGVDVSAYRIVQEALTNALRHAGPARARVRVRYGLHELEIEVADDGGGAPAVNGAGHGLAGMRERVAIYGGELTAGSRPEGGFRVRARLPLPGAMA
jgi:signal transduction histidine kinase